MNVIERLAAWLAADPVNPVVLVGVLLIAGMVCYGVACELHCPTKRARRRGGRR